MKYFFKMFWNDRSVAERVTRMLFVGGGTSLTALKDSPNWVTALGVGLAAMGALIGAGEKNVS